MAQEIVADTSPEGCLFDPRPLQRLTATVSMSKTLNPLLLLVCHQCMNVSTSLSNVCANSV